MGLGFDLADIRPGMDVYTLDNIYLGSVLEVRPGPVDRAAREPVPDGARQSSAVSGELLGPAPTAPLGNPGPTTQSAANDYAVRPADARPIGQGAIRVGRWWGLRGARVIPAAEIQTVSLERVMLRRSRYELEG